MLKKTTLKLSLSIFGATVVSVILSIIILMTIGGIGSTSSTSSSVANGASSAISSSQDVSSSSSVISSSSVSTISTSSASANLAKVLDTEGGLVSYTAGKVLLGTFCIIIFLWLMYTTAWHEGNKDPNRIKFGRMKKFMAKGLVAGLFAAIPYAILTLFFVSMHASAADTSARAIVNSIYRIFNMQYIIMGDGFTAYPVVCFLLLLLIPAFSALGYLAGYRNLSITSKIVYKKKDTTIKKSGTVKRKY
jgi:hypothetical protein